MAKIDSSYFGSMIIDGKKFDRDLQILPSGEIRERERTHIVSKREISDLLMHEPNVIVIGTGNSGLMKVDADGIVVCQLEGVEIISKPTPQAVQEFNKLNRGRKIAAVFHVTC